MKIKLAAAIAALSLVVFGGAAVAQALVAADENTSAKIVLHFTGHAIANTSAPPNTPTFEAWCEGECVSSVMQPVYDPATGGREGRDLRLDERLRLFG